MKQTTLCYLLKEKQVLLAMKKRGFGNKKWNGLGGKLKKGETIFRAVKRETKEEAGIIPLELEKVAKITFFHPKIPNKERSWTTHVFFIKKWQGKPVETEEMLPKWFSLEKIPYDQMWPDDTFWLPRVLKGEKIIADFVFDENDQIIEKKITSVESFPSPPPSLA